MTLSELRYIVAVAREGHFRRAAEKCFVSQPALSLAVQKLEEELGVRLFERSRTEVRVTEIGLRIVEQAQRALDEVAKLKEIAVQARDPLAGALRLGVIFTIGPYLLPELIPLLRRRASGMPLEVEENLTANLEASLRNGRLDAIVIALPFEVPGVLTRPLYDEPFTLVVPADHPWSKRRSVRVDELAQEKVLLLPSGHCFSNQVLESCPDLRRQGGEIQQGNSLETIRNMVASGLGVTVLPLSATGPRYRSKLLSVVPFRAPVPRRRVALAWRKSFGREEAIEALAQAIRAVRLPGLEPV